MPINYHVIKPALEVIMLLRNHSFLFVILAILTTFFLNAELNRNIDPETISLISGKISPYKVRFTQDSIAAEFSDGGSVFDMIKKLRDGSINSESFPPIKIFVKDGVFYSVDNRRLFAFQQANLPIKYEIIINPQMFIRQAFKFTTLNDGREIIVRTKNN